MKNLVCKLGALATMLLLAVLLVVPVSARAAEKQVTVGGKNFTEQYLLAELAGQLLEKHGFDVTLKTGVGSAIAWQSLKQGQMDMYYEYTGTSYTVYNKQSDPGIMSDSQAVYDWVKKADAKQGLTWLKPIKFNNTYTLMMRKDHADKLGITSISDLASYINAHPDDLVIGVGPEFWERPDGFKKLMKDYDFKVPRDNIRKMDLGLTYMALKEGEVDVAMGFATDGRIAAFGFVNLVDNMHFFPVYNPAPVVREEVMNKYPEIAQILEPLTDKLTTEEMQKMNAAVDVEHKDVSKVAEEWRKAQGLL